MKNFSCLFFLILQFSGMYSQTEEYTLWDLRSRQNASEDYLFRRLTKYQDSTFPKSFGLLETNDTLRYANGNIFRTCEVSKSRLNGTYKMYYPSGILYCSENYRNGYPSDTSYYYDEKGLMTKKIFWKKPLKSITWFYTTEQTVKKKYISKYPDRQTGNLAPDEKKYYYNREGKKISKKEYYEIYGDDKLK